MKIKKYIAGTMPEAMKEIRMELGPDAIILNSKEILHGGFLGLFKKKKFEVVAGIDPQPLNQKRKSSESKDDSIHEQAQLQNHHLNTDVLTEIKQLKKVVEYQATQSNHYLPDYQLIYQHLLDQEVSEHLARNIVDVVIEKHQKKNISDLKSIQLDVQLEIEKQLTNKSFTGITYDHKIVHFVGSTGVGKTTTIAKIAAKCILVDQKKIAFITTDTYRVAAIDQLKTYAEILDVPLSVAYSVDDYQNAIQKYATFDLILVDTAGRNYRDEQYMKELTHTLNFGVDFETYLVLSLTSKAKDIIDIQSRFNQLSIKKVIFTKLDETTQYGSILNLALDSQKGISYLTDGQSVPDDLIQPTPRKISTYLLGGYFDE